MSQPEDPLRQDGIGASDDLDRLWTPHRMAYIRGENKPLDATSGECPFCRIPTLSDEDGLIVARGEHVYAVLNLFPYNPGHLMVLPFRHMPDYTDLDGRRDMGELVAQRPRRLLSLLAHSPTRCPSSSQCAATFFDGCTRGGSPGILGWSGG